MNYTLRPCRYVSQNEVEVCDRQDADLFTIYRVNPDGTEQACIDYEFDDSHQAIDQWRNANRELERLNGGSR